MWRMILLILLLAVLGVAGFAVYFLACDCELETSRVSPALEHDPAAALPGGVPADPAQWVAVTLADLAAARHLLEENTPIPFDSENRNYGEWLVQGYQQAIERARLVSDFPGYFYTLSAYINGFHDPHIAFNLTGEPPNGRWPGFIATARDAGAEVAYRDDADVTAPPVGAKIIACDGQPVDSLVRERIYPFRFNPALAEDRRQAVTRLFVDRGNPFAKALSSCQFEFKGQSSSRVLNWRDLPKPVEPWYDQLGIAGTGPSAEWGISEPAPSVYWIGVPTFGSGDETAPKLEKLIAEVTAKGNALRQGRAIVIDTRGNGGGNSAWADSLAEGIFTPEVLERFREPERDNAVDWRASEGNASYWRQWSGQMVKEFGTYSVNRFASDFLGWQLDRYKERNPPLWRLGSCRTSVSGGLTRRRPKGASPFPARVYMLSNGSCGSSCLNFADRVLMVPGVKLIGADTSGDGPYMEVRDEALPGKLGSLTFPQKVERGAGRGALEAYRADVVYSGSWSDAAVRAWVMDQVEAGR